MVRTRVKAEFGDVTVVPASRASCEHLQAILGERGDPSRCQCQRYKIRDMEWRSVPVAERARRLREQTACGRPGVSRALAAATIGFARERGARALEAYPMITHPGREITWGELHVGSRSIFEDAGFAEVHRPLQRRVVMRVEFGTGAA